MGFRSIGRDTTRRDVSKPIGSGGDGRGLEPVDGLPGAAASRAAADVHGAPGQETRTGILLDTETTGLDHASDEIIELGLVKFDYTPDGRIAGVRDTFSAFNEPSAPIPPEVTTLTGITNEMVAGHRIDEAAVNAFVESTVIVIAHNSGFDRKFAERYWPVLEHKAGGCSMREIDWRNRDDLGA